MAADEVDTDEELAASLKRPAADDAIAATVDTDDELSHKAAPPPEGTKVWCLWGRYEPARLMTVMQAFYQVRFDHDSGERWATASELVLPDMPVAQRSLQPGTTVLRPVDESGPTAALLQGTLVRRVPGSAAGISGASSSEEHWVVRADDAAKTRSTHAASALRLPVIHGNVLGSGQRLRVGERVLALRGVWRAGLLEGSPSRARGRCVKLDATPTDPSVRKVWVSGGQLALDEAADPDGLLQGSRVLALDARGVPTEVSLQSVDLEKEIATCVDESGEVRDVALAQLRTRLDTSFRVLVASGGFQRAKLHDFTPDGMYAVKLASGSVRWLSGCEIVSPRELELPPAERNEPLPPGTMVCVAPSEGVASARWLSAALVVRSEGETVCLRRPARQTPLIVRVSQPNEHSHAQPNGQGFGFVLDASSRIVELRPGSAADEAGLCVGDRVLRVDGEAVRSEDELSRALAGKGTIELAVAVERDGGEGGGDADGDGEIDEGADGTAWEVSRERVLPPLLTRGVRPRHVLKMGDEVFAMIGSWREALVEAHAQGEGGAPMAGRYLVHHGRGERRWADGGELAWHDIAPMQFDVAVARPMLAWHARSEGAHGGAFQSSFLERPDGAGFVAKFDSGTEAKLGLSELRERWTLPLRIVGLHGNYLPCKVLEALGGLLRVEFSADQSVRWALPEQLLAEEPVRADLAVGSHVAVERRGGMDADPHYERASLYKFGKGGDVEIVREGENVREVVPMAALRRTRLPSEMQGLVEGATAYAMHGVWRYGLVGGIMDDLGGLDGRVAAHVFDDAGKVIPTTLSKRDWATLDSDGGTMLAKLKRGAPIVMACDDGSFIEALLVKLPDAAGLLSVMLADGVAKQPHISTVRARVGEGHPYEYVAREAATRGERFEGFQVILVQKRWRALVARRTAARKAAERRQRFHAMMLAQRLARGWAARRRAERKRRERDEKLKKLHATTFLQRRARGWVARRRAEQKRREREMARAAAYAAWQAARAAAAKVIQGGWRRYRARNLRKELKLAAAKVAAHERERAATVLIQARWRGKLARIELGRRREAAAAAAALAAAEEAAQRELEARQAAVRIQGAWRLYWAKKLRKRLRSAADAARAQSHREEAAATRIQSMARRRAAIRRLRHAQAAATTIQARARGRRERQRYARTRARIVLVQSSWRRHLAIGQLRRAVAAATKIEAEERGRAARRRYRHAIAAAITIQAHARGWHARRRLCASSGHVVRVQSNWRRYKAIQGLRLARAAATRIAAAYRRRVARVAYLRARRAAITIQTYERRASACRRRRNACGAAIVIEAHARGMFGRREARRLRRLEDAWDLVGLSILEIQRCARGLLARRLAPRMRRDRAATLIQRFARGRAVRRPGGVGNRAAARHAVIRVQASARRLHARHAYARTRARIERVQARARTIHPRRAYAHARAAATTIERFGRGLLARRRKQRALSAARALQRGWRTHRRRVALYTFVAKSRAIVVHIQRIMRGRKVYKATRPAVAQYRADKAAKEVARIEAAHTKRALETTRLHSLLARTDASAARYGLGALAGVVAAAAAAAARPSSPDPLALYTASANGYSALAKPTAARRRRLPHEYPSSELALLEPKAAIAQLAAAEARLTAEAAAAAANPLSRYSLGGALRDELLEGMLASRAYRGKPVARRAAGDRLSLEPPGGVM